MEKVIKKKGNKEKEKRKKGKKGFVYIFICPMKANEVGFFLW